MTDLLTENAKVVLKNRYIQKDEQGNPLETYDDIWRRVARDIASAEKTEELKKEWEEKFYQELKNLRFLPNTPTIMNAGTNNNLGYNACFVIPLEDSIIGERSEATIVKDSIQDGSEIQFKKSNGITEAIQTTALVQKTGGGTGYTLDNLRPTGDWIESSKSPSGGPIPFWYTISAMSGAMQQGGKRRGANMMTMSLWHPDILKFITAKDKMDPWMTEVLGYPARRFGNFNISIKILDEEMNKIINSPTAAFIVKNPRTNKSYFIPKHINIDSYQLSDLVEIDKIPAGYFEYQDPVYTYGDVWEMIVDRAWNHADPGIIFWDRVEERNVLPFKLKTCNPCQPGWATVLTKDGIRSLFQVDIGTMISNGQGKWTKIINKVSTGVKPVYAYKTNAGIFYGTKNHRVLQKGEKIEVKDATSIDTTKAPKLIENKTIIPAIVMDGLVLGDGTVHKASGNLVGLLIGKEDHSYFESEISDLIKKHRPGIKETFYEIETSITAEELQLTYLRKIPERFIKGNLSETSSFLRGLYSANGSIASTRVTLKAASLDIIRSVQEMLSSLGIRSYFTTNKSKTVEFSNGEYVCRQSYDLNISTDRNKFREMIGFIQTDKQDRLDEICKKQISPNGTKTSYEINEIEYLGEEEVFDITVDCEEHTYWTGGLLVSNCGEQALEDHGSCNLGSIDLAKFTIYDPHNGMDIDWASLQCSWKKLIRFLDNVIDVSPYPTFDIKNSAQKWRRIGPGVMGFANLLFKLGIPYNSEKALIISENIGHNLRQWAEEESIKIAKEKGPFEGFNESWYAKEGDKIERRNAFFTTIAPTGTISIIAGTTGGIEPVFSLAFKRQVMRDHAGKAVEMIEANEIFSEEIERLFGKTLIAKYILNQCIAQQGSIQKISIQDIIENANLFSDRSLQKIEELGESLEKEWNRLQSIFKTAHDIDWKDHVKQQAIWTKSFCSGKGANSISKTTNMHSSATKEDVKEFYRMAWESGCIGTTMYRAGSHEGEPMTTIKEETSNKEEKESVDYVQLIKKKETPNVADSIYVNQKCHAGTIHVQVVHEKGNPIAVFAQLGKGGEDVHSFLEALGRSISMGLQNGVPIDYYIKQFRGITTSKATFTKDGKVVSIPDALSFALSKAMKYIDGEYLQEDEDFEEEPIWQEYEQKSQSSGNICPECGDLMQKAEGCHGGMCHSCGHSEC